MSEWKEAGAGKGRAKHTTKKLTFNRMDVIHRTDGKPTGFKYLSEYHEDPANVRKREVWVLCACGRKFHTRLTSIRQGHTSRCTECFKERVAARSRKPLPDRVGHFECLGEVSSRTKDYNKVARFRCPVCANAFLMNVRVARNREEAACVSCVYEQMTRGSLRALDWDLLHYEEGGKVTCRCVRCGMEKTAGQPSFRSGRVQCGCRKLERRKRRSEKDGIQVPEMSE